MTREEAISIMNVIVHMLEPQYDTDRIEDAVEMAIEALKQEPITVGTITEYCKEHGYILCEKGTETKILDDIKAEIEHMVCRQYEHRLTLDREEVLEVINKHMKEGDA